MLKSSFYNVSIFNSFLGAWVLHASIRGGKDVTSSVHLICLVAHGKSD